MRIIRGGEIDFVPASHEDPGRPGVLKRVLATRDQLVDGRVQMVNWARLPAGSSFRAHYHEDMQEMFIILHGQVEVVVDGETDVLRGGDAIVISPREVHVMRNTSGDDVDYIVLGVALGRNGRTIVVEECD